MSGQVDILENDIVKLYPNVLDILLRDHTTQNNIIWGTENYEHLGSAYEYNKEITSDLITAENGNVIMPRVQKDKMLQQSRSKDMAEVFTPSWVCNAQNNLIDKEWFKEDNIFNREVKSLDGTSTWVINTDKIQFPSDKTWKHYVRENRLEMACGEAPYITSRYDTTTGDFIPVEKRIGLLDRKLRVINENVHVSGEWLKAAQSAYQSIYAFEWQGDNLLLAREAMLFTFIENYRLKFYEEPLLRSIKYIAYIISWNAWQMDGIKGVIPESCTAKKIETTDLFGVKTIKTEFCEGCVTENIKKHTGGIYALIKDWSNKDKKTGRKGRKIRYIDLLNN